jgi:choice-of-anchor B domain-containing protein
MAATPKSHWITRLFAPGIAFVLLLGVVTPGRAASRTPSAQSHSPDMLAFLADRMPVQNLAPAAFTPCVGGHAGIYPCNNVDLDSFLPLSQIGGGSGSGIWGWTDPLTTKEYAIMGRSNGTSFVDISDPVNPIYVGNLPTDTVSSPWREVNVYANYAFIVCDACGSHGMQIFDLTQLRNVPSPPVTFSDTVRYTGFSTAHTITIDAETGFAYANGSNKCSGGPYMIDISDPLNPVFAGCNSIDGYTHDNQCVIYRGPDVVHRGREICFESNEDTLTIVDVTDKGNPVLISRTSYQGVGYTHQGWLTSNQKVFVLDDELDELDFGHTTWTRFWDIRDLEAPSVKLVYQATTDAIDHNQYVNGKFVYQANYRAGLHVLKLTSHPSEVAFFDIYPADDQADFNAAWGTDPFFASGTVIISGIEQGLFVVHPNLP